MQISNLLTIVKRICFSVLRLEAFISQIDTTIVSLSWECESEDKWDPARSEMKFT